MKMPARKRRPIQMITRRAFSGLDWIMMLVSLRSSLFLTEQLIEKRLENVVGHDAGVGIGLALAMKDGRWSLVDAIGLAKRVVLVDGSVERTALYQSANLGHFRGGENVGDGAVHVPTLFPLFLILEESLFHGLHLAELRGGAGVACGDPRVRVHGEREIALNEIDLAAADVIVHETAIRGGKKGLAGGALKIAEDLHRHGGVLRAKGLVRIHVGETSGGLRGRRKRSRLRHDRWHRDNRGTQLRPRVDSL